MLFGIPEMKAFAARHADPRVVAIYNRMESSRSLAAKWCESHAKIELENTRLRNLVEELQKTSATSTESEKS